ncbi:MAG: transposase [bacterium]|nr:transposase [bacterium]
MRQSYIIKLMPHRSEVIAPFEHYHIFNRGVRKENIFLETDDYIRILFLILYLQVPIPFRNIGRFVDLYKKRGYFLPRSEVDEVLENREVELCAFSLMPNHYHLLVHELKENGISSYLQRVQVAYAMYFNKKYRKSGYVFQGRFQSVHVQRDRQLSYLSAYIHLNARELKKWKNKEAAYPWSSYQDVVYKNRWGDLLSHSIYSGQFNSNKEYKKFVETSGAKEWKQEIF